MDMFASGASWLDQQMRSYGSRSVTLSERATSPALAITLDATIGSTPFEEEERDGVILSIKSRDFLVPVSQLIDEDGIPVLPLRGWIITDTLTSTRYEVYAPAGAQPYRYCDTAHRRMRIHTRHIDDPRLNPSPIDNDSPDDP